MLLTLSLPPINPHAANALIRTIYATEGSALTIGAKLLDVTVDLSKAALLHDCPPVSYYRLVMRDRAWLRRLDVAQGQIVDVGGAIAVFSTDPDEPLDAEPARPVRVTIAGVIFDTAPWDEVAS